MKIAISGPAASGKGTVSRLLANRLGLNYIDLGLLFRGCVHALDLGLVKRESDVLELVRSGTLSYRWTRDGARVEISGRDVTDVLASNEVARATSLHCREPGNLRLLIDASKQLLEKGGVVVDGRSAGSLILPDADFKFFLTADLEVRASRRAIDLGISKEETMNELSLRDEQDRNRELDPLKVPQDALVFDSGGMSPEETCELLFKTICSRNY